MLDEAAIAPCSTIPTNEIDTARVVCLQLTFVKGGMLIVFNGLQRAIGVCLSVL
jgi:hypothetical protein